MKKPTKPREPDESLQPKKPYRTPKLEVFGDFRKLTAAKGGDKADATGKPSTRVDGMPA